MPSKGFDKTKNFIYLYIFVIIFSQGVLPKTFCRFISKMTAGF